MTLHLAHHHHNPRDKLSTTLNKDKPLLHTKTTNSSTIPRRAITANLPTIAIAIATIVSDNNNNPMFHT